MKKFGLLLTLIVTSWGARAAVSTDTVTSVTVSTSDFMSANIALDSHNNVHMVFVDTTTQILKYAKLPNGTTTWAVSDVSDKKVAPQNDLAISAGGVLHAVYYQTDSPAGVKHARLSGASWVTDTVENFVGTNTFVSIAVGTDNVPRVVYNQTESSTTWYGELSGSAWATQMAVAWTGGPCALALAPDNTPHFLTVNDYVGLRYDTFVRRVSSATFSWIELIPGGGLASPLLGSEKVGLAIDRAGTAHVSYFDEEVGGLVYASVSGVTISSSTLDSSPGAGAFSDIAVNDRNDPMIVYFSSGVGFRSAVFGTSWTLSTLESGTLNGVGPSVAFNRHHHYVAGFLNGDSNELKFITDAPRDLSISGTVLDFSGAPIPGATLTLSGGISSTDLPLSGFTGAYSADHLFEGSYTLTPSKSGYSFLPSSSFVNPLQASTVQNFQGGLVEFTTVGNLFNPLDGVPVIFNYSVIPGHVSLKVYSLRGTPVRTLVDQDEAAGDHSVSWDGRDSDGNVVASGIYLVSYEANQNKSTKKVAVVK